jgi:hypothetical protein
MRIGQESVKEIVLKQTNRGQNSAKAEPGNQNFDQQIQPHTNQDQSPLTPCEKPGMGGMM